MTAHQVRVDPSLPTATSFSPKITDPAKPKVLEKGCGQTATYLPISLKSCIYFHSVHYRINFSNLHPIFDLSFVLNFTFKHISPLLDAQNLILNLDRCHSFNIHNTIYLPGKVRVLRIRLCLKTTQFVHCSFPKKRKCKGFFSLRRKPANTANISRQMALLHKNYFKFLVFSK